MTDSTPPDDTGSLDAPVSTTLDVRSDDTGRIPPGQVRTAKWPVLHYGDVPDVDAALWRFEVTGLVEGRDHGAGDRPEPPRSRHQRQRLGVAPDHISIHMYGEPTVQTMDYNANTVGPLGQLEGVEFFLGVR